MYPRAFWEKRMCCDETASRAAAASERLSPRSGRATQKKCGDRRDAGDERRKADRPFLVAERRDRAVREDRVQQVVVRAVVAGQDDPDRLRGVVADGDDLVEPEVAVETDEPERDADPRDRDERGRDRARREAAARRLRGRRQSCGRRQRRERTLSEPEGEQRDRLGEHDRGDEPTTLDLVAEAAPGRPRRRAGRGP